MTSPREQLGAELRRLRKLAGLSGPQLAQVVGTNQSRISRTEVGAYGTNIDLVTSWLEAVGASELDRRRVLGLAEEALTDAAPYRRLYRGSMLTMQRERIQQDAQAAWIRHFQPAMIPGPLQSAAYARAVLAAARQADEVDVEEAVAARLERGRRLMATGAARYEVLLTEAALHWWPVEISEADRIAAWRHLASVRSPNITIRVVPMDVPSRQAPTCGFMMTQFADSGETLVQVELPAVEISFGAPADVAEFQKMWHRMEETALTPQQSAQLIRRLARGTGQS